MIPNVFSVMKQASYHSWYLIVGYSWPAICIHGDKEQRERDWVLSGEICMYMSIEFVIVYISLLGTA